MDEYIEKIKSLCLGYEEWFKNKNERKGKVHLILNGRTSITKKENGKEVYRFDGQLEKGKIMKN